MLVSQVKLWSNMQEDRATLFLQDASSALRFCSSWVLCSCSHDKTCHHQYIPFLVNERRRGSKGSQLFLLRPQPVTWQNTVCPNPIVQNLIHGYTFLQGKQGNTVFICEAMSPVKTCLIPWLKGKKGWWVLGEKEWLSNTPNGCIKSVKLPTRSLQNENNFFSSK